MNPGYPLSTPDIARQRRELAPTQQAAFDAFGQAVFAEGVEGCLLGGRQLAPLARYVRCRGRIA